MEFMITEGALQSLNGMTKYSQWHYVLGKQFYEYHQGLCVQDGIQLKGPT